MLKIKITIFTQTLPPTVLRPTTLRLPEQRRNVTLPEGGWCFPRDGFC